jgi:hypothetical protein
MQIQIDNYYFGLLELTLKTWLLKSHSVGASAKSRSSLSNAMVLKCFDAFVMIQNVEILHGKEVVSFIKDNINYRVHVKSIITPFEYSQCVKLTASEERICTESMRRSIKDIINVYSQQNSSESSIKSLVVFSVYPCTHIDKDWETYLNMIKPFVNIFNQEYDYRFTNNVPGCLYICEINERTDELDKIASEYTYSIKSLIDGNSSTNRKDENSIKKYKIKRHPILENIRKEMIENNSKILFEDLQELFQKRFIAELKNNYPEITEDEENLIIDKFESKGSGAKKAHLLLTTVNEKSRVYYRPNIQDNYSLYNLFYYTDDVQPYKRNKYLKAFYLENKEINDDLKVYYEKGTKGEEPKYELVKDLRKQNKVIDMRKTHFGILASIDWNSNNWEKYPTSEDIVNSDFTYVREHEHTFTYLNFGHKKYSGLSEGEYEALIPHFWSELPSKENSKYVNVVFIKSKNYNDKKTYIVGLYAFPRFEKKQKLVQSEDRVETIDINLISKKEDILLLEKFLDISDDEILKKILPQGKQEGKRKYNYLTSDNVRSILDLISASNPDMIELKSSSGIKYRLLKSLPS